MWEYAEAEYRQQILDCLPIGQLHRLLDVGCDNGAWTQTLATRAGIPSQNVAGIEIVQERRVLASQRGFDVRTGDLEETWPFDDAQFDVVHANQVIEHVKRLDHFVEEIRRVLAPGGTAIVCTENLAAWHNIAALVLGYVPFSLVNVSTKGTIGNPFALHADDPIEVGESWQHVHVLTIEGLRSLFRLHGFVVARVIASGYPPLSGWPSSLLARVDPRHAHFIGVVVRHREAMHLGRGG